MSTMEQRSGSVRRTLVLAPSIVLLLGLVALAGCLLLLFGPFYPEFRSPGLLLQSRLLALLGPSAPRFLWFLVYEGFFASVVAVLAVVLVLVPWRTAVGRQRSHGRPAAEASASGVRGGAGAPTLRISSTTRVTRTERNVALTFADDGSIVGGSGSGSGSGELRRSVSDLRLMARAARIPWHTDYETEGGARAFLEILRAQHTGPAPVPRADQEGAVPPATSGPVGSAGTTAAAGSTADSSTAHDPAEEHENPDDGDSDLRAGSQSPEPSWSPSYSGSVYTSTTLYSPEPTGRGDTHGGDEDER